MRGFAQPTLSLGVVHLERNCKRLFDLRLAATGFAAVPRRSGHHRRLYFHRQRIVDVAGLHCLYIHHPLAAETGILSSNRLILEMDQGRH